MPVCVFREGEMYKTHFSRDMIGDHFIAYIFTSFHLGIVSCYKFFNSYHSSVIRERKSKVLKIRNKFLKPFNIKYVPNKASSHDINLLTKFAGLSL